MEKTVTTTYDSNEFQALIIDCLKTCLQYNLPVLEQPKQSDILDIHGAADLTGFKVSTLYTKVNKRTIPYRKVKGTKKLFFSRTELLDWLQDGYKETAVQKEQRANDYLVKK